MSATKQINLRVTPKLQRQIRKTAKLLQKTVSGLMLETVYAVVVKTLPQEEL
jgi:uncharacterized protein (DUF1778 family)